MWEFFDECYRFILHLAAPLSNEVHRELTTTIQWGGSLQRWRREVVWCARWGTKTEIFSDRGDLCIRKYRPRVCVRTAVTELVVWSSYRETAIMQTYIIYA
eukprot:GHVS01021568.1.p1 GENE.GHVS01021568.1~~GHVS01021568.1.p1  ORF type:complete len:101 (+),score=8.82 GHVS01021568.1:552-854(+)